MAPQVVLNPGNRVGLNRGNSAVALTITARRIPRQGLKWLHKPLAQVLPTDVEEYIHDRLDQEINPATVDRELDLISQVLTWSSKTRASR
jgi:hypothetical protein